MPFYILTLTGFPIDQSLLLSCQSSVLHPPTPSVIQAWWTSSAGYLADIEPPPEVGGRWLVGCDPVAMCTSQRRYHPRDARFSQDHCQLLSCIHWPCHGVSRPKGLLEIIFTSIFICLFTFAGSSPNKASYW